MKELLIQYIEQAAQVAHTWGPFIIFVLMAIESSVIPLPSEVVMIPAGFLAARHELFPGDPLASAIFAVVCGALGSIAGAYVNYGVSLKLGRPFLYAYGKYFFLSPHALERAEGVFREYGNVTTFVCRLLPGIRHLISIPAGLSRMKLGPFTLFTGLGAALWCIILTAVGYHFGNQTRDMSYADLVHKGDALVHENLIWIVVGCAVIVVAYIFIHRKIMTRGKPQA